MKRNKISIVGAGHIGGTVAYLCALKELGDIVLVDITEGLPQGKGLDIGEATPIENFDCRIKGTTNYNEISNSDIVIITAGIARKPGMSRDDLLKINCNIVKEVSLNIKKYAPEAIVIVVSNPLDAMTYVCAKVTGFPRNRVIGMAGILDSARFRYFISQELSVSAENVNAMVLGGHGDDMVPLVRHTYVAGIPLTELLPQWKIDTLIARTRNGGAEIVELLKTGSAYYAPSSSIVEMIETILKDKNKILPCSAYLEGEYAINGLCIGVPVKLGKEGIHNVIEIDLNEAERKEFDKTVKSVKNLIDKVEL